MLFYVKYFLFKRQLANKTSPPPSPKTNKQQTKTNKQTNNKVIKRFKFVFNTKSCKMLLASSFEPKYKVNYL